MLTQRRARILRESFPEPRMPAAVPLCTAPAREERRPPARDGFTAVYGRVSGWYYRREREP